MGHLGAINHPKCPGRSKITRGCTRPKSYHETRSSNYSIIAAPAATASIPPETRLRTPALVVGTEVEEEEAALVEPVVEVAVVEAAVIAALEEDEVLVMVVMVVWVLLALELELELELVVELDEVVEVLLLELVLVDEVEADELAEVEEAVDEAVAVAPATVK